MDETDRRRETQKAFNKEHGITPKGILKSVADIMEGALGGAPGGGRRYARVADDLQRYSADDPDSLARQLKELEARMYRHAENLEFEEAARVRDEVNRLREVGLKMQPAA